MSVSFLMHTAMVCDCAPKLARMMGFTCLSPSSFPRADQKWDTNTLMIYYTTNNPDQTVNLFTSAPPFTTHQEFDPGFGPHDAFLLHGPYVFAQRTDNGKVNLYVSHMRKPFKLARIPTPYNHQNYLVNNIDELLALVVIEHEGGFYNLYLSDTTGMDYTLSLRDLVVERGNSGGYRLDLEIVSHRLGDSNTCFIITLPQYKPYSVISTFKWSTYI